MGKKGLNVATSSSPNDNKFFKGAFAVSNLSTTNIIGSEIEDTYQNIIRDGWIFNIKSNIHIYNSLKGFTKTKNGDEIIKAEATPLTI